MGAPSTKINDLGPSAATTSTGDRRTTGPPEEKQGSVRRQRAPRSPRFWFEIALIAVSYFTYSLIRNAVPEQRAAALRHADWVWQAEHALGIAVERTVNHAANGVTWLIVSMNYYYATLHFVVTIGVLVWLFRKHPGRYGATRTVIFATTGVALVGYYLFPLAPPRLMDGGFIDTVRVHGTWGSMASGNLADMSNQYAAMPSMHIGWSVWCGVTIAVLARPVWARVLGALYPVATLAVIVGTANHFWLDALGGILCLGFGYGLAYAWYGGSPHSMPRRVAGAPVAKPLPSRNRPALTRRRTAAPSRRGPCV
ncbi:phosphatase PAP2 family protein [Streptomyces sp. TR06-5]|uniref:phosphatase PAP2 family protein n=1 Tax=unclassified Streptomyces TaxID=2593676 RepID=UPI0039A0F724